MLARFYIYMSTSTSSLDRPATMTTPETDRLIDTLKAQTETIAHLTESINQLSILFPSLNPPELKCRAQSSLQFWYRTWHSTSRAREDKNGDIISGNPEWKMGSEDDIALHFAEFHSDKTSKKDTALISATHDPIRAIKAAYDEWRFGSFKTRNARQIFISVIQSSDVYIAKDLNKTVLETPLCTRLSKESCRRVKKDEKFYESEGLFVSRILKEQIKARISLQDLFDKQLLDDMLPELDEKYPCLDKYLSPSAIRNKISCKCDHDPSRVARRLKTIYCALAGVEKDKPKKPELEFAEELMQGDPTLDAGVKEVGLSMIQEETKALRRRRAVPVHFVEETTSDD